MKYLERKQRCGGINVPAAAEKQSSDSEIKEAYFKGTLLDRVASLEHRLFQLCVEVDSSGSSYPLSRASTRTSGESSSSQGSKGEISYSFPTFNNLPNHGDKGIPQNHNNKTLEFQEKSENLQHQKKNPCPDPKKQVVVKNRAKKNEKKPKSAKKQIAPTSWPHLKLLGC
ncbi:uncharacterized protein LOC130740130 [Lotus japonicus]|uniref:uncharacterized protein LOC130740130 n=1 Tax=Lotus japonicus TaxID=34305 RepID=UPI002589CBA9|nr:uncharacterized protein LOC130740130 [Lotus japonicus]